MNNQGARSDRLAALEERLLAAPEERDAALAAAAEGATVASLRWARGKCGCMHLSAGVRLVRKQCHGVIFRVECRLHQEEDSGVSEREKAGWLSTPIGLDGTDVSL